MRYVNKIFILLFILTEIAYGKTGIHLIPFRAENEEAINSGLTTTAKRIVEGIFSKEPMNYNLRLDVTEALRELEMQKTGLVKEGKFKYLEAVDYFIIGSLWKDSELVIFELRAMDAESCKIMFSKGITVKISEFKNKVEKLAKDLKIAIERIKEKEKLEKDTITVNKIEEEGNQFLAGSVTAMFLSGLYSTGEFEVIEREQASWAIQEKEIEATGIVNRDPLKKVKEIYNLKLAIEGYVVTRNAGMITFDIKVVDMERATLLFQRYGECYSYEEMRAIINKMSKDIAEKYYRKAGKVKVASIPSEAAIYINGRYWAKTPIFITEIDKGVYNFLLQKEGYENYEKQVEVIAGKVTELKVKLIKQDIKYFRLGLSAEKNKQWEKAIEYFEKFAEAYPKTKEATDAKFRIAHIYHYNLREIDTAIKKYYELIKSYSGLWILSESMYGMGSCLIDNGETEEGRDVLEGLIREYPETSAADYAEEKLKE